MNGDPHGVRDFFCKTGFFRRPVALLVFLALVCCGVSSISHAQQTLDRSDKERIMKKISELFIDKYVFPDLGKEYGREILSLYKSGVYESVDDAKEFAGRVTADLQKISNDQHISFRLIESSDIGEKKEGSLHHPVRLSRLIHKENMGFQKFEWLEGNIGYLDLRRFNSPAIAGDRIVSAMNLVSGAWAIIIDLRENQGGTTDFLPYFCSYFFDKPVQLNSDYFREGDILKENWTRKEIAPKKMADVPLFLLTSHKTFSAAESFAYDMQVRGRAVIVGDSTRGGAHSVDLFKIDDRFEIYISTARSFNPVTNRNWEGFGVIPDVYVPAGSALDTAIVLAGKAAREFGRVKDGQLREAVIRMQAQLDRADSLYQKGEDEAAGALLDSAIQTGFDVDLIDEFFMQVLAYDYWAGKSDRMLFGVLKKNTELFPDSFSAHESLAWAYFYHGKNGLAAKCFRKVLELDPDNTTAPAMLEKIENEM
jgi:tetratricopeptide (TPR) repeat protein